MLYPDTKMILALKLLNSKFKYKTDTKLDSWRFLNLDGVAKVEGDCDDFAATLAFELSDRSYLKFWWNYITFRFMFWRVKTDAGAWHIILKYNGFYVDNAYPIWRKDARHKLIFPMVSLAGAFKLAVGKIRGK